MTETSAVEEGLGVKIGFAGLELSAAPEFNLDVPWFFRGL